MSGEHSQDEYSQEICDCNIAYFKKMIREIWINQQRVERNNSEVENEKNDNAKNAIKITSNRYN